MAAGGGAACFPWLIPAGKLTSAHRAWAAAANGRVAGLPARCVTVHGQCATILMMPDYFLATFMLIWQAVLMGTSDITAQFKFVMQ